MAIYTVHNIHKTTVAVPAKTAAGREVVGQMQAAIIELVPADPWRKSYTMIEPMTTPDERASVDALFKEGGTVNIGAAAP